MLIRVEKVQDAVDGTAHAPLGACHVAPSPPRPSNTAPAISSSSMYMSTRRLGSTAAENGGVKEVTVEAVSGKETGWNLAEGG
eukprot:1714785-Rhodomonas_salina.1